MKRCLFTILSALSLLLCVAVVVLWVRSYAVGESITWYRFNRLVTGRYTAAIGHPAASDSEYRVGSSDGFITFSQRRVDSYTTFDEDVTPPPITYRREPTSLVRATHFGIDYHASRDRLERRQQMSRRRFVIAYWLLTLATLPLPLLWGVFAIAARRRKRIRMRSKSCPSCGYDLRATPDRCPECGQVPTTGATS